MRSWQSGAAISPTIRTGSSPPPSSTGGQLSAKTLPVEVFIRRWYQSVLHADGNAPAGVHGRRGHRRVDLAQSNGREQAVRWQDHCVSGAGGRVADDQPDAPP